MKISVIGANGQLGSDVCNAFKEDGHEVFGLNHDAIEIGDFEASISSLRELRPDVVINTAAKHNVDECEDNALDAFVVNGLGARNLAMISNELGFRLIHVSTDYVFDGSKREPYIESDSPFPLNVYGNSKLCGEHFIRSIAEKYYIVRTSALYGTNPCRAKGGMNFIRLMLHLAEAGRDIRVVDDEIVSPTFTVYVARQLVELAKTEHFGTYHMTAQGDCSWYQFAKEIFRLVDKKVKLAKASPDEFPTKARRPKYSVLKNHNLKSLNLDIMPDWQEGLRRYLDLLNNN